MRVQLAALDPAVRVAYFPMIDPGVILVDPDTPEHHAVLMVALFAETRPDVARGWLRAAYAQDPRRSALAS